MVPVRECARSDKLVKDTAARHHQLQLLVPRRSHFASFLDDDKSECVVEKLVL